MKLSLPRRKLLLGAAAGICAPAIVRAQQLSTMFAGQGAPGVTLDAATVAWVNQVVTNGGTVSTGRKTTVNTMIVSMKSAGVWSLLDRLWILAAENSISARTDMVGLTLASVVGSPTFTTDRGFTGTDTGFNGATNYLDSGWKPNTGVNFTQNACHVSGWSTTNNAATNGGAFLGVSDTVTGVSETDIIATFTDGNVYARLNDASGSGSQGAPSTRQGHWLTNRSSSSSTTTYQNASALSPETVTSGPRTDLNMYICAANLGNSGTNQPSFGTPNQIAMASVGGDLTSVTSGVTNFYNALRTYMTAVGVP